MVKREIAERFAATAVECVTIEQAQAIIVEFLTQLAKCPVCDGSGSFTFRQYIASKADQFIKAGSNTACPLCLDGYGDPDIVIWYCSQHHDRNSCQQAKNGGQGQAHEDCGYRIMLPLPNEDS